MSVKWSEIDKGYEPPRTERSARDIKNDLLAKINEGREPVESI